MPDGLYDEEVITTIVFAGKRRGRRYKKRRGGGSILPKHVGLQVFRVVHFLIVPTTLFENVMGVRRSMAAYRHFLSKKVSESQDVQVISPVGREMQRKIASVHVTLV